MKALLGLLIGFTLAHFISIWCGYMTFEQLPERLLYQMSGAATFCFTNWLVNKK